jgi:hypothetical protein
LDALFFPQFKQLYDRYSGVNALLKPQTAKTAPSLTVDSASSGEDNFLINKIIAFAIISFILQKT